MVTDTLTRRPIPILLGIVTPRILFRTRGPKASGTRLPTRFALRFLLVVAVSVAASAASFAPTFARSVKPAPAVVCHCAHCPGGAACCCRCR